MTLANLFVICAAVLFVVSTIPGIQRGWMIGMGLALLACGFLPFAAVRLH